MARIFLDANILFSAALSDGAMRQLLRELVHAKHVLVASPLVVAEATRNLSKKSSPEAVSVLNDLLHAVELSSRESRSNNDGAETIISWLVEKDRHVLRAAILLNCNYLVTGDRAHFGEGYGRSFAGIIIVSPRQLAERLLTE
jgi:uncharacterized protein